MNNVPQKPAKIRRRNDIVLILVFAFVAAVFLAIFLFGSKQGDWAIVTLDGKEIARYSLSEEGEYPIRSGEKGEYENILVIKNGKASVSQANCPDGICVSHRAINRTGETIVCLPHKFVVHIETKVESEIDMVS